MILQRQWWLHSYSVCVCLDSYK